jgi:hypothetical protein
MGWWAICFARGGRRRPVRNAILEPFTYVDDGYLLDDGYLHRGHAFSEFERRMYATGRRVHGS